MIWHSLRHTCISHAVMKEIDIKTVKNYSLSGTIWGFPLAVSMGAMWLAGMILYGMGANELGTSGSSIGWAIVMSLMVLVASLWGLLTGEWREAGPRPRRIMTAGLTLSVAAMFIVGSGIR